MKETDEQILGRVAKLNSMANSLCGILTNAAVGMEDELAAEMLFKRVREHISMVRDNDEMYQLEYYMERVHDLVELSSMFKGVPVLKEMHKELLDHYEVLLFNKSSLFKVLNDSRKQDTLNGLRENYWKN